MATNKKKIQKSKSKTKPKPKAKSKAKSKTKSKAPPTAQPSTKWSRVISPLEDRLLISVEGASETTVGGIIIPGSAAQRPNRGKVLAVGPGRRSKKGKLRPPDVKVGDEIVYPEYAGTKLDGLAGKTDEELLILREDEVLGVLT